MTNSQWVICHLCQSLLFIWQTGCEWENILNNLNLSHHDQQEVCGTLLSSHITLLMTWATGSEWNFTLCPNQFIKSHLIANRGWVMHLAHVSIKFHASANVWQDVSVAAIHSARYPYCVPQQIESWVRFHICSPNSVSFHEKEGELNYCVGFQAHLSPSHNWQQVRVLLLL